MLSNIEMCHHQLVERDRLIETLGEVVVQQSSLHVQQPSPHS